ncbi:unnamed protein product [Rotaria sp. Silwood1]|nr:unnamed protein product [Rotaria sp. Silwood1]CAF4963777.1 unnamed protein product [Rotaria sp. Silwood1]
MKSFENLLSNKIYEENKYIEENLIKYNENNIYYLPYYYNDIDRNKCENILRLINRPGCFLIRQHNDYYLSSLIKTPYVLSIISPSLNIYHYILYRINKRLFIKPYSNKYYYSLKHIVKYHQEKAGLLPCTLVEYPIRFFLNNDKLSSSFSSLSSLTIQTNKLIRQHIIGHGYFSIVYKGLYNGYIPVAIKTCSISSSDLSIVECQSNMLYEAKTMININHPYLVHFYGIYIFDNQFCLVIEYIHNGSLLFWLQKQQQQQTFIKNSFRRRLELFSFQIIDAMSYLETKLIIHRDLAARNCLINDNENIVKVSDFGMARQMSSSSSSSMFYQEKYDKPFPLRWSSPEVLINRKYSSKSDV